MDSISSKNLINKNLSSTKHFSFSNSSLLINTKYNSSGKKTKRSLSLKDFLFKINYVL